jgi:hypothetical protein
MKQNVGPAAIVAGACALIIVVFILYRVFLPPPTAVPKEGGFQRPSYAPSTPGGNGIQKGPAGGR